MEQLSNDSESTVVGGRAYTRRLLELEKELRDLLGTSVQLELNALNSSAGVFVENYRELLRYLVDRQDDPENDLLDQARMKDRETIFAEIHRLMHNFLAASYSLKEHTRAVRKSVAPGLESDYESETARRFTSDGIAQFCEGLRNYSTHREPIPLGIHSRGVPPSSTTRFVIRRQDLMSWSKWSPAAKSWLLETKDDIVLVDIASQYIHKVMEFQVWFWEAVRRVRRVELSEFKRRQDEYFLFKIETALDAWLAAPERNGPLGDRGLFLNLFDRSEFEMLESLPSGSEERAKAARDLLERHIAVPDRVASKLHQAYRDRRFFPR